MLLLGYVVMPRWGLRPRGSIKLIARFGTANGLRDGVGERYIFGQRECDGEKPEALLCVKTR